MSEKRKTTNDFKINDYSKKKPKTIMNDTKAGKYFN